MPTERQLGAREATLQLQEAGEEPMTMKVAVGAYRKLKETGAIKENSRSVRYTCFFCEKTNNSL